MLNSVVVFNVKEMLSFNVLPNIVSRWHTNKPWYSLPKDYSFTTLTARLNPLLPNLYAYTFVHTHAIIPCRIFVPCVSVCVPLSLDRGLPLSPNSVLHVRPQIILVLIRQDVYFSTRALIWVHFKTVRYSSQSIFGSFSYLKKCITQFSHWIVSCAIFQMFCTGIY